jgi:hypothetical protein
MKPGGHEAAAGRLLRYLRTWQAPSGAWHGVHTHPVWRIHPGVLEDHYTGWSAWGAPGFLGLADLVARTGNETVTATTRRLAEFVLASQMGSGRWDHCGAELGQRYNDAPVDNFLQDLSLCHLARVAPAALPAGGAAEVAERVRRNLETYFADLAEVETRGHLLVSTVNQDCAGIWAMLEWMRAFGRDAAWLELALRGLRTHAAQHLVRGLPTADCAGMLRSGDLPDYIEPAEYYGVIIPPHVLAYRETGEREFLDVALALARHVMRNAWRDARGCLRLHRTCDRVKGEWRVSQAPMLVAGGGLFLRALVELQAEAPSAEAEEFLREMEATLASYQNEFGFIAQATDWHDDYDLICGTVWQAHDLAYLGARVGDAGAFGRALAEPGPDLGIVIGWHDCWVESATQWGLVRPWSYGFGLSGNKADDHGYPTIPAWCNPRHPVVPLEPAVTMRKVGEEMVIRAPGYGAVAVTSIYGKKWVREE